jgi:hypothetical protein
VTVSNGSTILAADVNAVHTTNLSNLNTLARTLPALTWMRVAFPAVVTGSADAFKSYSIIIPDDFIIAEVAVASGEGNGADTVTLDNSAMLQPISISHTRGAGFQKATRWYSDATHATGILLKGSTLIVTLSTTNTSASSNLVVAVGVYTVPRSI